MLGILMDSTHFIIFETIIQILRFEIVVPIYL